MQILAGGGSVDVLITRAHTRLDCWLALWTISAQVIDRHIMCNVEKYIQAERK